MSDRCTGHCCRSFHLPYSPTELRRYIIEGEQHLNGRKHVYDGLQILDMVMYLGWKPADEDGPPPQGHIYTCKNLNVETNDCTAYETRPGMCRDYPYNKPCRYQGCTEPSKHDVSLSRLRQSAIDVSPKYKLGV